MMKKWFVTLAFLAACFTVYGQNNKINAAEEALKSKKYDQAIQDIETALNNDKTKNSGKAWYIDGEIHAALAAKNKDIAEAMKAYAYIRKALELEPKSPDILFTLSQTLSNIYVVVGNIGFNQINSQNWDSAYTNLAQAQKIAQLIREKSTANVPIDTNMLFYTGYAAYQIHQSDSAFSYFKEAAGLHYAQQPFLYLTLAKMYEDKGMDDTAIALLEQGEKLFPGNSNFSFEEIGIYDKSGKTEQLIAKLKEEQTKNPSSYPVTLSLAIAYDNMANPHDQAGADLPKPLNADSLNQLAIAAYKQAIALQPDNYAANFNLGLLYYNQAVAYGKSVTLLGTSATSQKRTDSLVKEQEATLDLALPFLEKTFQILDVQSKLGSNELMAYKSALSGLKEIYARKNLTDQYNVVKTKLDSADAKAE